MLIQFKTQGDFSTAVTYLINQTFCFDQHPVTKSLRFFAVTAVERALSELKEVHNITGTFDEDLRPALV